MIQVKHVSATTTALLLAITLTSSRAPAQVLPQSGWPVSGPLHPDPPHPQLVILNSCVYDIDLDGQVEVFGTNQVGPWMWSFEPNGMPSPTWTYTGGPGTVFMPGIQNLLHFGDITGDGVPEIVFTNNVEVHAIYALSSTGEMLPGFPLQVGDVMDEIGRIVLADLTGDGTLEIIVQDRWVGWQSRIWVFSATGTVLAGWPRTMDGYAVAMAVGDLEFDGELEIVASGASEWNPFAGPYPIYVFDANGNTRPGWPVTIPPGPNAPGTLFDIVIADLDGDYRCEILGPGWDVLYILDSDGQLAAPVIYGPGIGRPPAVGDLNGDGRLEIVIPGWSMSILDFSDSSITHLPAGYGHDLYDGVVICDTDGDGICEIGARSAYPAALHLWNSSLQPIAGWPKPTPEIDSNGRRVVSVADLDADGDLEMVNASKLYIECWDISNPSGNPLRIEWGTYNHDGQRTGYYHHGQTIGPRFVRGDADGDGVVRFADVFAVLGLLFGATQHECPARIDWEADSDVDLADVFGPLSYLFASGAPPSPPFPNCNMTSPGALSCDWEACP